MREGEGKRGRGRKRGREREGEGHYNIIYYCNVELEFACLSG